MSTTVAVYTRVSQEDLEVPASTRRQEDLCRRFAASRGWEIANVWEDVDLSAYQRGVRRPSFESLMRDVSGGRVNGVLVWKLDRLVRRSSDFEKFWTRCEHAGVFLASATEPIDSTSELGLAVIRILVTFANVESTSISLRMQARNEEKARAGIPPWKRRPFGFTEDAADIIEEEAVAIREAAQRILGGETAEAIASDWNKRRIVKPVGTQWRAEQLISMLRSYRLEGHNTYKGKVVARNCFPAILEPPVAAGVRTVLADRLRPRPLRNRYLLTGLLLCSICSGRLMGQTRKDHHASGEVTTHAGYGCRCGKMHIPAHFVEDLIVSAVLYRLEARSTRLPQAVPPADAPDRLVAAYEHYASSLRDLAHDYYVERLITAEEWVAARDGLERQLHAVRRDLDPAWRMPPARHRPSAVNFRADWESFDRDHKRDIIASELQHVIVYPPTRRARPLDVSRVRPKWWEDDPELSDTPWVVTRTTKVDVWDHGRWMPRSDVATALGLSRVTLDRLVGAGELTAETVRGKTRFLRADVDRILQQLSDTITTAEAAHQLDVHETLILRWVARGRLPAWRYGRRYHLDPADVEAFGRRFGLRRSDLLTMGEAQCLLGIKRWRLSNMIKDGELREFRRGNVVRLYRDEVLAAAEELQKSRSTDTTVSPAEVCTMFGVSRANVQTMIESGVLPAQKVGYRYRIERDTAYQAMLNWRGRTTRSTDRPAGTLTTKEAAKQLGVTQQYVAYCAWKGELPAVKGNCHLYLHLDDLSAWAHEKGIGRNDLIGKDEAKALLGVSTRELSRLIGDLELHTLRQGRFVRLYRKEVTARATRLRKEEAQDKWIDTKEAARRLGVSGKTVRRLICEGHLPATKVKGSYRYRTRNLHHARTVLRERSR